MKTFDSLLTEAQNPNTESDRLWEIKNSDLSSLAVSERHTLVSALADHANADEDLCIELLREWPNEALASTRLRLMLLADNLIDWNDIFDKFSDALPALNSLVEIPSSHKAVVGLFETALLGHLDDLSCSFDWNLTYSHEISISWQPTKDQVAASDSGEHLGEVSQDFTFTISGTVEGNHAILRPPNRVDNIKLLFAELEASGGTEKTKMLSILRSHGWDYGDYDNELRDYAYFELESVEPELDDWDFSSDSIMGDGSGTLCVVDPSGEEHEIELPAGDMESTFSNYTLEDNFKLSDVFNHDKNALNAFRRIIG